MREIFPLIHRVNRTPMIVLYHTNGSNKGQSCVKIKYMQIHMITSLRNLSKIERAKLYFVPCLWIHLGPTIASSFNLALTSSHVMDAFGLIKR